MAALPTYVASLITVVSRVAQGIAAPSFIMGGQDANGSNALFKKSDSYTFALLRSEVFRIGRPFTIDTIHIPLYLPIDADMEVTPVVYFDDGETVATGTAIDFTNYSEDQRYILLTADSFGYTMSGDRNFYLELQHTGSALLPIGLPITVVVEDEPTP